MNWRRGVALTLSVATLAACQMYPPLTPGAGSTGPANQVASYAGRILTGAEKVAFESSPRFLRSKELATHPHTQWHTQEALEKSHTKRHRVKSGRKLLHYDWDPSYVPPHLKVYGPNGPTGDWAMRTSAGYYYSTSTYWEDGSYIEWFFWHDDSDPVEYPAHWMDSGYIYHPAEPSPSPVPSVEPSLAPTAEPTIAPTPEPTATPTPTPSVDPTPPPTPDPTPTPPPQPIEICADEFFSPNFDPETGLGDGRMDTNAVDIHAKGEWTVSVGETVIYSGRGDDIKFWDGRLNPDSKTSPVLPDGKYTLTLKSGDQTASVDIILDTVAPEVELTFVNAPNKVVDTVIPEIQATVNDYLAGFSEEGLAASFQLDFSKRRDDVTPKYYTDNAKIEVLSERNAKVVYQIPFEQDAVLYSGTQTVDFRVEDLAGNRATGQEIFAVGDHNKLSGGGNSNAKRVLATDTSVPPPLNSRVPASLPEEYRNSKYKVIEVDPSLFFGSLAVASRQLGYSSVSLLSKAYLVQALGATSAVTIVLFDFKSDSVRTTITNTPNLTAETEEGTIVVTDKTWDALKAKARRIDAILLTESLEAARRKDHDKVEFWGETDPKGKGRLMVYKGSTQLMYAEFSSETNKKFITDAEELLGWSSGTYWPESEFVPVGQMKWAQIAKKVMKYEADYRSKKRFVFGWNPLPKFARWRSGDIQDGAKPYMPGSALVDGSVINKAAVHWAGRLIASLKPRFSAKNLDIHYGIHKKEFPHFDESQYASEAQYLIHTGQGRQNNWLKTHVTVGNGAEPKGRVYLWNEDTLEFVSFDPSNAAIITYMVASSKSYWSRQIAK